MGHTQGSRSIPFPYPPFLAFAPLDVWFRLLFRPRAVIPARYWPRVAVGLLISTLVTILTLPERLLVGLWLRLTRGSAKPLPGPVIVLGYYRSGTTHLQFLLNCDPNLYSPRWNQALSPQGFLLSWTLIRFFLLPFLSRRRPQDNVAFGSDVPAEDDFALCNWALVSSLPGRHLLPRLRSFYDRFHDLRDLSPAECGRFRGTLRAFVRKLALLGGGRRILLKTPSHTARVGELCDLFADTSGVKFIHISRRPDAVVRSNVAMHQVLNAMYHLQDPQPAVETEEGIVREYLATEENYLAARARLAPGQLVEVRLEDLQADPLGQLKRIYAELGLPYTEAFEQRVLDYLDATRDFTPNVHTRWTEEQKQRLTSLLEPLVKQFHHDQPAVPKVEPPRPAPMEPATRRRRLTGAALLALAVGGVCVLAGLALTHLLELGFEPLLVWPTGIAVGCAAIGVARRGSPRLGLWSALVTVLTLVGLAFGSAWMASSEGAALVQAAGQELFSPDRPYHSFRTLFWSFMGTVTAYRLASRPWA